MRQRTTRQSVNAPMHHSSVHQHTNASLVNVSMCQRVNRQRINAPTHHLSMRQCATHQRVNAPMHHLSMRASASLVNASMHQYNRQSSMHKHISTPLINVSTRQCITCQRANAPRTYVSKCWLSNVHKIHLTDCFNTSVTLNLPTLVSIQFFFCRSIAFWRPPL
jgi:hypothetical protein